jgi:AAA domain, putative AbiEii toxin, Type IV TA system
MGDLILNSLEIRNFRGFQHLRVEHLGRVNLIVGKNNIGKSSLLEALQLYARRGVPDLIWDILSARDENRQSPSSRTVSIDDLLSSLKYLFYGRKEIIKKQLDPIVIAPINSSGGSLTITIGWYVSRVDEDGNRKTQLLEPEEYDLVDNPIPRFTVQLDNQQKISYPLRLDTLASSRLLESGIKEIDSVFVSANGLDRDKEQDVILWDGVALTSLEDEVLHALRIIAPGVEGLNFLGDIQSVRLRMRRDIPSSRSRVPIPTVKIADIDEPLPLRTLGDGMQRILGIVLALANAKDGIVLIDEIENGIHYSAQPELWQMVFQLAHRLNVQVFATTHSWDCIEGFQKAALKDTQEEGMLIRLSLKKEKIAATLFDEEDLAVVTREQIEVR